MTTAVSNAAQLLEHWLTNGELAPRLHDYLQSLRQPSRSWTWYTKVRDDKGQQEAERRLEEMVAERNMREVSTAIEKVALGMLQLATVNPKNPRRGPDIINVVTDLSESYFPGARRSLTATMIVIMNPEHQGCGCTMPAGSELFGPYGLFGLQAVSLIVDPGHPDSNRLCLVLPNRRKDASESAFVVAEFSLDGHLSVHSFDPYIKKEAPLLTALGMMSKDDAWDTMLSSGGNPDSTLGPGSSAFLSSKLAELGPYFTDVAAKFSDKHTH